MKFVSVALLLFLILMFLPLISGLFQFGVGSLSTLGSFEKVMVLVFPFVLLIALVLLIVDRETLISFFAGQERKF
jgi:hypothetical protein